MVFARAELKRVAAYGVAILGFAGWFGFNAVMAFYTYLWRNSPDRPDFAAGRIAPMYRHERMFFVVPWERWLSFYGLLLTLSLVILAIALAAIFFRREVMAKSVPSWLNRCALAAFLAWFAYAAWPLPF